MCLERLRLAEAGLAQNIERNSPHILAYARGRILGSLVLCHLVAERYSLGPHNSMTVLVEAGRNNPPMRSPPLARSLPL